MNIQLNKMKLLNFKGIRQFEVEFGEDATNIFGRNASGKTTIMDAFLWCLFGKDSTDRTTFEIKTLDENNKAYERIDHSVEITMTIDGKKTDIRRVYREKYTKKKGAPKDEFVGHVQDFYWDDVPMKESEFKARIAELINEQLFKLLTNTGYFNSLKWQDRRNVLIKLAGDVSNADVITSMDLEITDELRTILESGKSMDDYRKMISAKKKKLKDELILFPSRIDEAKRSMPEEQDFDKLESQLKYAIDDLEGIDEMISDRSKAQKANQDAVLSLMNKKQNLSRLMLDIEFSEKTKVQQRKHDRQAAIDAKKSELRSVSEKRETLLNRHAEYKKDVEDLNGNVRALRDRWEMENNKSIEFNDEEFSCPTCKRDFPEDQVTDKKAELTANFNKAKSDLLAKIQAEAAARKEKAAELQVKISNIEAEGAGFKDQIAKLQEQIKELETQDTRLSANDESELLKAIAENKQYQDAKTEREALELKISEPAADAEDNSVLLARKKATQAQIDELKASLNQKGLREKQEARVKELEDQEGVMAQELADLENSEFTIDQFVKAKMTAIEDKVNSMFKVARFKMFEQQINEGEKETCVTLINGVPYPDANTAAKVQVGLDIIETLSNYYKVKAPVFIDNRESVSTIPDTDLQIINLIVSPEHKKLTVGPKEGAALALFS